MIRDFNMSNQQGRFLFLDTLYLRLVKTIDVERMLSVSVRLSMFSVSVRLKKAQSVSKVAMLPAFKTMFTQMY